MIPIACFNTNKLHCILKWYQHTSWHTILALDSQSSHNPVVCKRMLIATPQDLYCIWHALAGGALFKRRCYFCQWHQPNATRVCFCMPYVRVIMPQHPHTHGQMFYLLPPPLKNRQVLQTLLPLISQMPNEKQCQGNGYI